MRRWLAGLVILLMFAAVWVPQWIAYNAAAKRVHEEINARQQQRIALEATAKKDAEFQEAIKLLAAKLERLAQIVPPTLDINGFVAQYRRICDALGFTVVDHSVLEDSVIDDHREAIVRLTLAGDRSRLPELQARTYAMARLATWKEESPIVAWHDGRASAQAYHLELTIYAWAPIELSPMKPCIASPEGSVVWPFSRQLTALHRESEHLCEEIDRFDTVREQVEAYQQRRKRLEDQIAFIEKVRAKRAPA
jgi:hypothetical protein